MKTCKCGSGYDTKYDLCPSCYAKSFGMFWTSKKNWRISMYSNGDYFVAQIQAGMFYDCYLSVGYSYPNYAWITDKYIPKIQEELDKFYETVVEKELDDMMPTLLEMCKIANEVYNELFFEKA